MYMRVIRYRVKPEKVAENQQLIEAVFAQLKERSPAGIRYASIALEDGSFIHIVDSDESAPGLDSLPAFGAFTEDIERRCIDGPTPSAARVVGNYGLLDVSQRPQARQMQ